MLTVCVLGISMQSLMKFGREDSHYSAHGLLLETEYFFRANVIREQHGTVSLLQFELENALIELKTLMLEHERFGKFPMHNSINLN